MHRIRSALAMKPGLSLKIPFPPLLHLVKVYTIPEISPHDSPAEFPVAQPGAKLSFKTGPCMSQG